ncbi:hypothetical protein BH09PLA1_BH09PLA1_29050 [soil metagenome]
MMTLVKNQPLDRLQIGKHDDGAERRRGLRIAQARPVKVFEHTSSRYFPGETLDVSATGLRIELPVSAPVRAGKLLSIHVGLSTTGESLANRRQMIPARVIWIDRSSRPSDGKNGNTMTAGIEFLASIAAHLDAA